MKCPNCKSEIDNDSLYCEDCGTKVHKKTKTWPWVVIVVIVMAGGLGYYLLKQDNAEEKVVERIEHLCAAVENDDFEAISQLYASMVRRYYDIRDISNNEVVEKYKNYNKLSGVYGKHCSVRWNTLQVQKLSEGGVSVVYVEDYSIDRYDKTKFSKFVLEKHIELDKDYRIVSVYDVQLGKSK